MTSEDGALRRLLEIRVGDLIGWGASAPRGATSQRWRGCTRSSASASGSTALTEAVARGLHKLTAYKDEYEVARLHLEVLSRLPAGSTVKFHLHPPLLRALGLNRNLKLGRWFVPVLRALRRGRTLPAALDLTRSASLMCGESSGRCRASTWRLSSWRRSG